MATDPRELSDELTVVIGSSPSLEIYLLDEDDELEDLAGATGCSLVVYDDPESGVALVSRRSDDSPATAAVNVSGSKVVVDSLKAAEYATSAVVTAIDQATSKITLTGDLRRSATMRAGQAVTLAATGLADPANAGDYTIASVTLVGSDTVVEVNEALSSDEFAITGELTFEAGVKPGKYVAYLALKVSGEWQESEPFYVNFVATKAPTF